MPKPTSTPKEKAKAFAEKMEETLKPLATTEQDQAPVVPFAPYETSVYEEPFSSSLLEKANELAVKIWGNQESYNAQQATYPIGKTEEEIRLIEKNKSYFNISTVTQNVHRLLTIGLSQPDPNSFYDQIKVSELIKKLKRLEKKYESDDLIDENVREQIINNILMPSNMYGVNDHFYNPSAQFRYPPQKSVVNELLTAEDMQVIESVIYYVSRVRGLLATFHPPGSRAVKAKRLLKDWMPDTKRWSSLDDDKRFLSDLANFANFFSCALPYNVHADMIPALKYPTASSKHYEKLREASTALRNATLGYVQEQKQLSDLLQAVVDLSAVLRDYFTSLAIEVEACFNFISRIDVAFDKLVEESKARIDNSGYPF